MRGTCVRRYLGLCSLAAVACAIVAGTASAKPYPGTFGSNPDAFERAVLRAQQSTPTELQSSFVPGWAIGAYNRSLIEKSGYTPEALQALGDRWQAYASWAGTQSTGSPLGDSHERIPAAAPAGAPTGFGTTPDAFERAVLRSESSGGYTPAALDALGKRWQAYAASQGSTGTSMSIADSHERIDLPATSPASTISVDKTGIAWIDVLYGMLLGVALVALGGVAAMSVRKHGRVSQS